MVINGVSLCMFYSYYEEIDNFFFIVGDLSECFFFLKCMFVICVYLYESL